jgi:endoglycosylceramidase
LLTLLDPFPHPHPAHPPAGDALANPGLLVPGVADRLQLQPFYFNLSAVIRGAEGASNATGAHRVIFAESITFDDFFPVGFDALPGAGGGLAALSWHYYSLPNFDIGWQAPARAADSARLGAAGMLTEFDVDLQSPVNAPYSALDMRATMDACDNITQGYLGWASSSVFTPNGSLHEPTMYELLRPFPLAVGGSGSAYSYDFATGVFTLNYTLNAAAGLGSVIYVNTDHYYTAGVAVTVTAPAPAQLQWAVHSFNGTAQAGAPPTYSYAYVTVTPAAGVGDGAQVVVTVADAPSVALEGWSVTIQA